MKALDWRSCIVTAIDFVGVKQLAPSGLGSSQMIRMRAYAAAAINTGLNAHSHGYIWNDSILLLSYLTTPAAARARVLTEISEFKVDLERHCNGETYAIAVKGLAFPYESSIPDHASGSEPRAIVLKTSSWAMANCFIIEKELRHHRAGWYIDSRITKGLHVMPPFKTASVKLLPTNRVREIHMYRDELRFERGI